MKVGSGGAMLPRSNDATEAFTPDIPQSPVINNDPVEKITLVPYGCTRVRMTYFPVAELPPPQVH
jgi:hypothetical protein